MRVRASREGHSTQVFLGQSSTATNNFDPREDSGLPPGTFGLQAVVDGNAAYQDMRPIGTNQTFSMRFVGLQPLKTYSLSTDIVQGRLHSYFVRRYGQSNWTRVNDPIRTTFRTTSTEARFQFKVIGQ